MFRTVDMRTESATFFGNFAAVGQREHLKTTAIGENGTVPAAEGVDTAGVSEQVGTRTQVEVVCIGKDYSRTGIEQVAVKDTFDTGSGADRHEHGRFDDAMFGYETSGACFASGNGMFK